MGWPDVLNQRKRPLLGRPPPSVFAKDIMKLSAVMAVIACIVAYFVAHKWLEQFAEKVSLNPLYFIGGALLVLFIVLGVVVQNCLKIARANPVESLKNE